MYDKSDPRASLVAAPSPSAGHGLWSRRLPALPRRPAAAERRPSAHVARPRAERRRRLFRRRSRRRVRASRPGRRMGAAAARPRREGGTRRGRRDARPSRRLADLRPARRQRAEGPTGRTHRPAVHHPLGGSGGRLRQRRPATASRVPTWRRSRPGRPPPDGFGFAPTASTFPTSRGASAASGDARL